MLNATFKADRQAVGTSAIIEGSIVPAFAVAASVALVGLPLASMLSSGELVIAHDGMMPVDASKALEQLDVLKPINGGVVQAIYPPMAFTTAALYWLLFKLGIGETGVHVAGMTLTFAVATLLATLGFDRLLSIGGCLGSRERRVDACLLGGLYMISPFTLITVNSGLFWIGNVALAIGILPLLAYFIWRCFVHERSRFVASSIAGLALCLVVVCWSVFFVYPLLILGAVLLPLRLPPSPLDIKKAVVISAVVILGAGSTLYGMYLTAIDPGWRSATDAVTGNAAYANIRGGILTAFLQHATWLIYTPWTPRLVLGFPSHFFSAAFTLLTLALLGIVISTPLLYRSRQMLLGFSYVALCLVVALLFVKGAGEPLGVVYKAVLENAPGGGLIRTPDTKFGLFVIATIAIVLSLVLSDRERKLRWFRALCRIVIACSVALHAVPFLRGQAVLAAGSDLATGGKGYAVKLSATERRIIGQLKADPTAAVIVLPPTFGVTTQREGGVFAYRHVISEFVPNPFYYSDWDDVPNEELRSRLKSAVHEGHWRLLSDINAGYVLVDRNTLIDRSSHHRLLHVIAEDGQAWQRIVNGQGYELFRLADELRRPLLSVTAEGRPLVPVVLHRVSWLTIFRIGAWDGRSLSVSLRSPENKHWRLGLVADSCTWSAPGCVAGALLAGPSAGVRSLPYSANILNRWQLQGVREAATNPAVAKNPRIFAVFVPQLVMFGLLGASAATGLLCLFLAARPKRFTSEPVPSH